jgi:hypothetical protein
MSRGDIRTVVDDMIDGKPETRTGFRVFTFGRQEPAPAAGQQETTSDWQRAA